MIGGNIIGKHDFILDSFTWSYSRANNYPTCPKQFKLQYIDCVDTQDNTFAQYGKFMHHLLEQYLNGELHFFQLSQKCEEEYFDHVTGDFPPNAYVDLGETYYTAGKRYLDEFTGLFDDTEILGVEEKFYTKIGEYRFTGFIDLIVKDDNGIAIVDHKAKGKLTKKEKAEFFRQLYIYSKHVYEKYGEYPNKLVLNMYRAGGFIEEKFDINKYEEALQWVVGTIQNIYQDAEFAPTPNEFFCMHMCSTREHCEHSSNAKEPKGW